jgi:Leucine-rich repeat (LRR) protein
MERVAGLIGESIHLRLLEINRWNRVKLPKSITKLYNLQTLIIKNCRIVELPKDFSNLINLRHIGIYLRRSIDIDSITPTPKDMGQLTCLQTLSFFAVDQDEGRQIKELGCLNQLRGELDIYNLIFANNNRISQESV